MQSAARLWALATGLALIVASLVSIGGCGGGKGEARLSGPGAPRPAPAPPPEPGSGGGGGAASNDGVFAGGGGGGAGGGAVRIEAQGDIEVTGTIDANGGDGGPSTDGGPGAGGSGGSIHLKSAGRLRVSGRLQAAGGYAPHMAGRGGEGRIRLEDSVGDFRVGRIKPALSTGVFATSFARSRWYPVRDSQGRAVSGARFLGLTVKKAVPQGTSVAVEVEGARADPAQPLQPDPSTRTGF